jgi:hypothetical protein
LTGSYVRAMRSLRERSLGARRKSHLFILGYENIRKNDRLQLQHQVGLLSSEQETVPAYFSKNSRTKIYGFFAHRNPVPRPRADGTWVSRSAERRSLGPLPQEPPLITLDSPVGGPTGFCGGLDP